MYIAFFAYSLSLYLYFDIHNYCHEESEVYT